MNLIKVWPVIYCLDFNAFEMVYRGSQAALHHTVRILVKHLVVDLVQMRLILMILHYMREEGSLRMKKYFYLRTPGKPLVLSSSQ